MEQRDDRKHEYKAHIEYEMEATPGFASHWLIFE
jgi:hypothetical protein